MMAINPGWGVLANFLLAILGAAESTGVTNLLTTTGGKAGAVAATAIAVVNMGLHSVSSTKPGPLAPADNTPVQARSGAQLPPRS